MLALKYSCQNSAFISQHCRNLLALYRGPLCSPAFPHCWAYATCHPPSPVTSTHICSFGVNGPVRKHIDASRARFTLPLWRAPILFLLQLLASETMWWLHIFEREIPVLSYAWPRSKVNDGQEDGGSIVVKRWGEGHHRQWKSEKPLSGELCDSIDKVRVCQWNR